MIAPPLKDENDTIFGFYVYDPVREKKLQMPNCLTKRLTQKNKKKLLKIHINLIVDVMY